MAKFSSDLSRANPMDIRDLDGKVLIVGGGIAGLMTALKLAPEPCVLLGKAAIGEETSRFWRRAASPPASARTTVSPCRSPTRLPRATGFAIGGRRKDRRRAARGHRGSTAARRALRPRRRWQSETRPRSRALPQPHRPCRRRQDRPRDHPGFGGRVRSAPSVTILEGFAARRLSVEDGEVAGLIAEGPNGLLFLRTNRVVIATGGVSGLFSHGTNPVGSWGQGLAIAARAGALFAISNSSSSIPPRSTRRARKSASSAKQCAARARSGR